MEQKTIGGFISALRKANGMTQRELAERLNVSDKTVSRWERDDGAPDLTLIPVIAEIFGVTCDELLRGEKKSAADADPEQPTPKGEKERRRLLSSTLSKYRDCTFIAMGVSVVGLIAALIGNLALVRAVLGFLLGCVFFAASVVCQVVFVNRAMASVADSEGDEAELGRFRARVISLALRSFGLTTALVGFTFPLVLVDSYMGLSPDSMLLFGALGTALFLLIYAVVCHFLHARLLRQGVFTLEEKAERHYWAKHSLRKSCAKGAVIAVAVTAVVQVLFNCIATPELLSGGIRFTDYDSFIAFLETPTEEYYEYWGMDWEEIEFTDEYGNEISEEEALTETMEIGGQTITYLRRNHSIVSMHWNGGEDPFPITVYTYDHYRQGNAIGNAVNTVFVGVYFVEVVVAAAIYLKRRKHID